MYKDSTVKHKSIRKTTEVFQSYQKHSCDIVNWAFPWPYFFSMSPVILEQHCGDREYTIFIVSFPGAYIFQCFRCRQSFQQLYTVAIEYILLCLSLALLFTYVFDVASHCSNTVAIEYILLCLSLALLFTYFFDPASHFSNTVVIEYIFYCVFP